MGQAGQQQGTFGVFCQFQDADNYYYVEFDLEEPAYVIGKFVNGEYVPLTPENEQGQYWVNTPDLKARNALNHISISCYQDFITLFINNTWETEVTVTQPFDQPGEMAFFVYAFSFVGEDGYKVYFDNIEAYKPVQ